jgi:hypothetical protein
MQRTPERATVRLNRGVYLTADTWQWLEDYVALHKAGPAKLTVNGLIAHAVARLRQELSPKPADPADPATAGTDAA